MTCPRCDGAFTLPAASPPARSRSRAEDSDDEDEFERRPRRSRRRDDDDDEDFDYEPAPRRRRAPQKSRLAYIVLALFFGGLGVHNFYIDRTTPGLCQLLIFLASCALLCVAVGLVTVWIPILWAFLDIIMVTRDGHGVPLG